MTADIGYPTWKLFFQWPHKNQEAQTGWRSISISFKVVFKKRFWIVIFPKQQAWDVRLSFTSLKGRGARDQTAHIRWIMEKAREFQKNIYFCFIDYAKTFDCVDHNKLWKILKEMGIPDHLTCVLRNLYAGQEATVGTGHGTTDWFRIGKGVCQGGILSPCLFNLHSRCAARTRTAAKRERNTPVLPSRQVTVR